MGREDKTRAISCEAMKLLLTIVIKTAATDSLGERQTNWRTPLHEIVLTGPCGHNDLRLPGLVHARYCRVHTSAARPTAPQLATFLC